MKTTMIIMFVFWAWFITFLVLALRYDWEWGWVLAPIVGIIVLGIVYSRIYKENKP